MRSSSLHLISGIGLAWPPCTEREPASDICCITVSRLAQADTVGAAAGKSLANCETHRCLLSELLAAPIRAV